MSAIAENRDRLLTPPSWVDFGTGLPAVAQNVLLLICGVGAGGEWARIKYGFLEDGKVGFNWFVSEGLCKGEEVCAWCPFPILPKEER